LLGGDVIEIVTSNFQAGAVGAVEPGKVHVTFDMQIINKISGYELTTPTFPTPPSGVQGVQAFPFEISVTSTAGSVSSSGNEVVVTSPRYGQVVPSSEWGQLPLGDGNFHNFFNAGTCTATSSDCFRYEPFATIAQQGSSAPQRVGFMIDPTVGDFRAKIIIAADLRNVVIPARGKVGGTVTSNIGPVNGATITVTGGATATSDATGAYLTDSIASGPNKTVSISNLPSGCVANQASFPAQTIPAAGTLTVNFAVTCQVPVGTVSGTITKSYNSAAATGVKVVVTPTSGAAMPEVTTGANGAYTVSNVPTFPTTGTITLTNIPSGCTNPGPISYSGHSTSGTTKDIVLTCVEPPFEYPVTGTWTVVNGGPTGRQAQIVLAIDMGSAPGDLTIAGSNADPLAGITFQLGYDGTKLAYASRSLLSPDEFDLGVAGNSGVGTATATTSIAIGSGSGLTKTGNFQLVRLTFNIASGVTGVVPVTTTVTEALATTSLTVITSKVTLNIATLNIP